MECCEYSTRSCIQNTSFSLLLMNGPSKLECYITLVWKGFSSTIHNLLGPFVNYKETYVL
jgi:hypothetical protein